MQPSINEECAGTPRPLTQGTCVVPGVQLNLPRKFNVMNTNVLQFREPRFVVPEGLGVLMRLCKA